MLGALPGVAAGYYLGIEFTARYTDALGLPLQVTSLHPVNLVVGGLIGAAAAAAAAWAPANAAATTSPAEAMRISPRGVRGGLSAAERLIPPLRWLPARWRMTIRGLTRNPRRTLPTVIGVAVSVSLVMVFAGMRDTVSGAIDRQYGTIQLHDAEVSTVPGAVASVMHEAASDPAVAATERIVRFDVTLAAQGHEYQTLLVALPARTQLHRFTYPDGSGLPATGLLLGKGLKQILGIDVGDPVTITLPETEHHIAETVAGFVDEPLNPVAYISLEHLSTKHLSQVAEEPAAVGVLLKLKPGANEQAVSKRLTDLPGVIAYLSTATVIDAITKAFTLYDTLVGLMLAFAAVMAAALVYNAMSANVSERSVELGTLRAAGMPASMLGRLVATENLLLVVVGLPLGLGGGILLAAWFMSRFETEGYHWTLEINTSTPLFVASGVLLAALLAQVPALRSIHRIDVARIVRERSL